jgi:hypothetical protein
MHRLIGGKHVSFEGSVIDTQSALHQIETRLRKDVQRGELKQSRWLQPYQPFYARSATKNTQAPRTGEARATTDMAPFVLAGAPVSLMPDEVVVGDAAVVGTTRLVRETEALAL